MSSDGAAPAEPNAGPGPRGGPEAPVDPFSCPNPQCRRCIGILRAENTRLQGEIATREADLTTKREQIRNQRAEIREKTDKIEELEEVIDGLRDGLAGKRRGLHTERTWPEALLSHIRYPDPDVPYAKIHRLCCKEENMSANVKWVHPDIKLVKPPPPQEVDETDSEDDDADADHGDERAPGVAPEDAADQASPNAPRDEKPFPFENLPWKLQAEILKLELYKEGQLIHCLSRLDPFVAPESFPTVQELGEHRSGLKKRFVWGKKECSITHDGFDPREVLGILTVSKRFYFIGVHIFYGLNTFAFSSLGEFGRFCQGSGLARIARIQHIELLWTGNQYLTAPPDDRNRVPFSRRTYALTWFTEMFRLKTLVVHINETSKMYIRRGHENPMIKKLLTAKTAGQPNRRMTRSLRCVQGIDYIYNLRGLEFIRFYDFAKNLKSKGSERVPIQDWSYAEDHLNTGTLPKVPKRLDRCELENLEPLVKPEQNWQPSGDDWKLVKSFYLDSNGRCSYDDMRLQGLNHDADLASYLSVAGTAAGYDASTDTDSDGSESGSDSDSDSGADSDAEPAAPPPVRRAPRAQASQRQRVASPEALFVSSDSEAETKAESEEESNSDSDDAQPRDSPVQLTDSEQEAEPDSDIELISVAPCSARSQSARTSQSGQQRRRRKLPLIMSSGSEAEDNSGAESESPSSPSESDSPSESPSDPDLDSNSNSDSDSDSGSDSGSDSDSPTPNTRTIDDILRDMDLPLRTNTNDHNNNQNNNPGARGESIASRNSMFVTPAPPQDPHRASTAASSGLFMTPGPSGPSGARAPQDFELPVKRRESTVASVGGGLFVTPGPSGPRTQHVGRPDEPVGIRREPTVASAVSGSGSGGIFGTRAQHLDQQPAIRRESTVASVASGGSGMFVTPAPPGPSRGAGAEGVQMQDQEVRIKREETVVAALAVGEVVEVIDLTGVDDDSDGDGDGGRGSAGLVREEGATSSDSDADDDDSISSDSDSGGGGDSISLSSSDDEDDGVILMSSSEDEDDDGGVSLSSDSDSDDEDEGGGGGANASLPRRAVTYSLSPARSRLKRRSSFFSNLSSPVKRARVGSA